MLRILLPAILGCAVFAAGQPTCVPAGNNVFDCPGGSGVDLLTLIQTATPNRVIRLGAGVFNIPGQAVLGYGTNGSNPDVASGTQIIGMGPFTSHVNFTQNPANSAPHGFEIYSRLVTLKNFSIFRNNGGTTIPNSDMVPGAAVIFRQAESRLENVAITAWMEAVSLVGNSKSAKIVKCRFTGNGTGIYASAGSQSSSTDDLTILDNNMYSNSGYGIRLRAPNRPAGARIANNHFDNHGLSAVRIEGAMNVTIQDNYFESNEWRTVATGNDPDGEDAHILFAEVAGNQVHHATILSNFFQCQYPGTAPGSNVPPVEFETAKFTGGTATLRPWRFVGTPVWNGGSGTRLTHSGNNYVPVNGLEANGDSWVCTNSNTCFN